jgi:hypothetical protein
MRRFLQILPGTGRGTIRRMVVGPHSGVANPFLMNCLVRRWAPCTTTLRVAVPLPVPGRIHA